MKNKGLPIQVRADLNALGLVIRRLIEYTGGLNFDDDRLIEVGEGIRRAVSLAGPLIVGDIAAAASGRLKEIMKK